MAEAQTAEVKQQHISLGKRFVRIGKKFRSIVVGEEGSPEKISIEKLIAEPSESEGKNVEIGSYLECLEQVDTKELGTYPMGDHDDRVEVTKKTFYLHAEPDNLNSSCVRLDGKDLDKTILGLRESSAAGDGQIEIVGKIRGVDKPIDDGQIKTECVLNVSSMSFVNSANSTK